MIRVYFATQKLYYKHSCYMMFNIRPAIAPVKLIQIAHYVMVSIIKLHEDIKPLIIRGGMDLKYIDTSKHIKKIDMLGKNLKMGL